MGANPFREAISELLMKEWREKSQKESTKEGIKWTAMSSKKQKEGAGKASDEIGKYMKP